MAGNPAAAAVSGGVFLLLLLFGRLGHEGEDVCEAQEVGDQQDDEYDEDDRE
jgi:hypothetical protein